MPVTAIIVGVAGPTLTEAERRFLAELDPWGVILFRRNVESRDQLVRLTRDIRSTLARDVPILIDQEGGRVQRIGPPLCRAYPPGAVFGTLWRTDPALAVEATGLGARLIADDLRGFGIDVDCLPVLDVPVPGADKVIGDRAFAAEPDVVARLGRAQAEGLLEGGVLPVIKHVPGHGRAGADSHLALPVVDAPRAELEATDFRPFAALADLPLAMTAHVVYAAIDAVRPATTSPTVVAEVIRGTIGFDGCLMSDDLSMRALSGTLAERARVALQAGCDLVLHCNGDLAEMESLAPAVPPLAGNARRRAIAALASRRAPVPFDREAAERRFDGILAEAGVLAR